MSSEILRRAASLMRERAEDATPGPWAAASDGRTTELLADGGADVIYRRVMDWHAPADAEHIASWHPAVALTVADWLTSVVDDQNVDFDLINSEGYSALAVARAYLGGAA